MSQTGTTTRTNPKMDSHELEVQFPLIDLLHALQGYPGNLFQIESAPDAYFSIKDGALSRFLLHPSEVDVAKQFIDIASCHYFLQQFISGRHKLLGTYVTALTDGLIKSINLYAKCLDVIEKEILDDSGSKVPLAHFHEVLQFEDLFRRLKSIVSGYSDKILSMNEVLSQVWKISTTSSSNQTRIGFQIVMSHMKNAFLDDCWSWMTLGWISPASKETFFIQESKSLEREESVLRLSDDIPSFISNRVAEKILFIGNLVRHFSRKDWKNYQWDSSKHLNSVFAADEIDCFFEELVKMKESKVFNPIIFSSFVEGIRSKAAAFSSDYVLKTEDIVTHFEALKDILLTGNEKVWILFVDQLRNFPLDDSWRQEKKDRVLRSILENVLLKLYCDQEVVDEVLSNLKFSFNAKKKMVDDEFDDKEVKNILPFFITIEYSLPPLTLKIIQPRLLSKYQSLFNLLLELLVTRTELSNSWKEASSQWKTKRIKVGREKQSLMALKGINKQSLLRHKLLYFLEHLYFYLKVNVIEDKIQDLIHAFETCRDYEEMEMKHSLFVGDLMREAFIDYPAVEKMIRKLFSLSHRLSLTTDSQDLEGIEKRVKNVFQDIHVLFSALKEYRFHSSLNQLLLQFSEE